MKARYRSSIPESARETVLERYPAGAKKKAEYLFRGKVAGVRWFFESGEPSMEYGMKNGLQHGMMYCWYEPGVLTAAEPYVNGQPHGTARQWDENGNMLGTYTMRHGTGVDLWWEDGTGKVYLSEARHLKDGDPHGFEWWLKHDGKSVWHERHWVQGRWHGIERAWNDKGRLRRGYPRYWVGNERVSRAKYLRACIRDATLPRYRKAENSPKRVFPGAIQKARRVNHSR